MEWSDIQINYLNGIFINTENHLICIFMNIYETNNRGKLMEQLSPLPSHTLTSGGGWDLLDLPCTQGQFYSWVQICSVAPLNANDSYVSENIPVWIA